MKVIDHSGVSQHLPHPEAILGNPSDSAKALSPHSLRVWDDIEKFHSDMAFLLILPEESIAGERTFGLAGGVGTPLSSLHPYFDSGMRKLTLLTSSGTNRSYAFVWSMGMPDMLPSLGRVILVPWLMGCQQHHVQMPPLARSPSTSAVRNPSGVPWRTDGCLVPVVTSLPQWLAHGTKHWMMNPLSLSDLSQFTAGDVSPRPQFLAELQSYFSPCILLWNIPQSGEPHQHDHQGQWALVRAVLDTSSQA